MNIRSPMTLIRQRKWTDHRIYSRLIVFIAREKCELLRKTVLQDTTCMLNEQLLLLVTCTSDYSAYVIRIICTIYLYK